MNSDPFAKTEENSVQRQLLQDASREDVVVEALQECQAAIDAGKSIDREAILAKYPMIRDELSDCLEGLALMQLSKESLGTTPSRDASPATGQLTPSATRDIDALGAIFGNGDYRREIGNTGLPGRSAINGKDKFSCEGREDFDFRKQPGFAHDDFLLKNSVAKSCHAAAERL